MQLAFAMSLIVAALAFSVSGTVAGDIVTFAGSASPASSG